MEDDLNILKTEDDYIYLLNGRWPQFVCQWKAASKKCKKTIQPETFKIKTIVVAPLRVTYYFNLLTYYRILGKIDQKTGNFTYLVTEP